MTTSVTIALIVTVIVSVGTKGAVTVIVYVRANDVITMIMITMILLAFAAL